MHNRMRIARISNKGNGRFFQDVRINGCQSVELEIRRRSFCELICLNLCKIVNKKEQQQHHGTPEPMCNASELMNNVWCVSVHKEWSRVHERVYTICIVVYWKHKTSS